MQEIKLQRIVLRSIAIALTSLLLFNLTWLGLVMIGRGGNLGVLDIGSSFLSWIIFYNLIFLLPISLVVFLAGLVVGLFERFM